MCETPTINKAAPRKREPAGQVSITVDLHGCGLYMTKRVDVFHPTEAASKAVQLAVQVADTVRGLS